MSCCSCIHYCRWILQSLETQHTESFLLLCCIYSLLAGLFGLPFGCPCHGEWHLHSFDRARYLLLFAIIFFLPTALQLQSIHVCKKTFSRIHVRMRLVQRVSSSVHDSGEDSGRGDDARMANSTQVVIHSLQLTQPWNESSLYMTPYSSKVFSQCPLLCQS